MFRVCLILMALSHYHAAVFRNSPPYWGNCPKNAVENQACNNGRGYCAHPGESPASANAQLKCMPGKSCGPLPTDRNGFFLPYNLSDVTMGATATLKCCEGYKNAKVVGTTCEVSQEWSDPSEKCLPVDCGSSPLELTTFSSIDGTSYMDVAILECVEGYLPVDTSPASSVAICTSDGTWKTALECNPVDCGSTPPEKTMFSFINGTSYTDLAILECVAGFSLSDSSSAGSVAICAADGTWDTDFECIPDCGRVPPEKTTFSFINGTLHTDIAILECVEGFLPVDRSPANSIAICTADGSWDSTLECGPVDCGRTPPGKTKFFFINGTSYMDYAILECMEGFLPLDSSQDNSVATCSADGTWDTTFDCIPDCGSTPPENSKFSFINGTSYTDFAILECVEGFRPIDASLASSVAICTADGTWDTTLECDPELTRSGTYFIFGFMANHYNNDDLHVYVFSSTETEVTVSAPLNGFSSTTSINGSAKIVIPRSLRTPTNTGVFGLGFVVESNHPIDVYVEDPISYACEGSVVFPEWYLSKEYVIASWRETYSSSIAVIGTADGTDVTITLPGGGTKTTTINRYQLYHYMSTTDLTGAIVSCSAKCSVFAGSQCTSLLGSACDFLYEHMPPAAKLQMKYIASFPYPRRKYALRVIAFSDNTVVETNGVSTTLNKGQFQQYIFNDQTVAIVSDKPVLAADFAFGLNGAEQYYGPAMLVLPGLKGYRSAYDFKVPSDVNSAKLMLIIPTSADAIASLVLNGGPLTAELTRQVSVPGEGSFSVVYAAVPIGHNAISANAPFIASLSFFRMKGETWLTLPFNA